MGWEGGWGEEGGGGGGNLIYGVFFIFRNLKIILFMTSTGKRNGFERPVKGKGLQRSLLDLK